MSEDPKYKDEFSPSSSFDVTEDGSSRLGGPRPGAITSLSSLDAAEGSSNELSDGPANYDTMIGRTIDEKYLIEETLGRGAMAVVYRGKQLATDRPVALKKLSIHSTEGIMRFSREIRNHSQLHHPNIVEFIEFVGSKSGQFFLVMELAEGCGLQEIIQSRGAIDNGENLAGIMFQLCDALVYAHKCNVVHRDLKSSNIILMTKPGTDEIIVKVLDFGIAKLAGEARITLTGRAVGSPLYMSPEQCLGKTPTTLSDIYSLGVITYELVVGHPPYNRGSIKQILAAHCSPAIMPAPIEKLAPQVPCGRVLDQIILKCLEVDPAQRWQSALDLKEAFEFWYQGINSAHPPDSLPASMLAQKKLPDATDQKELPKKSLAELYDSEAKREKDELRQTRLLVKRANKKKRRTMVAITLSVLVIIVLLLWYLNKSSS